ncbi:MAG: TetR/AcrR family transcriptional regulator [Candidatus Binatia bacterium]
MGTHERREREKAEVRRAILDAARELFVEKGYEAVTLREIAKRIEYSPTAIYLHFRDKKAVINAICDHDFLALAKKFGKIAEIADPLERLRAAGLAYADFALKHPNQYRLMFMTPHPPHLPEESAIEVGNRDQDAYAFVLWTASEAIAQGRLRPDLDDPELVAQIVWAAIHGWVSLRMTKSNEVWVDWRPNKRSTEAVIEMTIRGIQRTAERPASPRRVGGNERGRAKTS